MLCDLTPTAFTHTTVSFSPSHLRTHVVLILILMLVSSSCCCFHPLAVLILVLFSSSCCSHARVLFSCSRSPQGFLMVDERQLLIRYNPPAVLSLEIGTYPMVGCPIIPSVCLEHADAASCRWLRKPIEQRTSEVSLYHLSDIMCTRPHGFPPPRHPHTLVVCAHPHTLSVAPS